jgi:hypothetical protein
LTTQIGWRFEDMPLVLPFRWVEYWPEQWMHGHHLLAESGENYESIAEEFAESILSCSPDRHQGHGITHDRKDADAAYYEALEQLASDWDYRQWQEMRGEIARWQLWQGPVPAFVLTPDAENANLWEALVTHPETGVPTLYKAQNVMDLPDPRELGAKPDSMLGWKFRKKRKLPS